MRRILAVLVPVLAIAACSGAPNNAGDFADRNITEGNSYLAQHNYQRALDSFNSAVASEPDYAPAYLVRGTAWHGLHQYDKAIEDYSQAIALGLANSPYVYCLRAEARLANHDYAEAIADYDHVLAVRPEFWMAYAGRGVALAESGSDAPRALAELDRAIAHDPGTIKETLTTMPVQVLAQKGPSGHGTKTLTITVGSKTLLAASYAARGKLRSAKGDYEAALADLDEAITREPELPYAHLYRGLTYLAVNRCQEGLQELYSIGGKDNPAIATALLDYSDAIAKTDCPDHML